MQHAKNKYNLMLLYPDNGSVESWTEEGSGDKMRADLRTLSHGELPPPHRKVPTIDRHIVLFQRPKAAELRQVYTQVAHHGPQPLVNLGASERPCSALR